MTIKCTIVSIIAVLMFSLCACDNKDDTVYNQVASVVYEDVPIEYNEEKVDEQISLTSEYRDIKDLPKAVTDMIPLCNALSTVQVDTGSKYSTVNAKFVWKSIAIALKDVDRRDELVEKRKDYICVAPELVNEYAYAMFGKLKNLPAISELNEDGDESIIFNKDVMYEVDTRLVDKRSTKSELVSALFYSDTDIDLEVRLVDKQTGEEIADFLYSMRVNTRDASLGSRFAYEIYNVRSADSKTYTLMKKVPYIMMQSQVYGSDIYEEDDPKYNEVLEIPVFTCYGDESEAIKGLNERIDEELNIPESDVEDDKVWHEIRSYPVVIKDYVQVLASNERKPNDDLAGNVYSYNYSTRDNKRLDNSYALGRYDITEEELLEAVQEAIEEADIEDTYTSGEYQAYIIRNDATIDFYIKAYFTDKCSKTYEKIVVYNYGTKELNVYSAGEALVSEDVETQITTPLSHGFADVSK